MKQVFISSNFMEKSNLIKMCFSLSVQIESIFLFNFEDKVSLRRNTKILIISFFTNKNAVIQLIPVQKFFFKLQTK